MIKRMAACAVVVGASMLGGCDATVEDMHPYFVADMQYYGTNPYITEPALKDLEQRMRTIAMSPDPSGEQWARQFNFRNMAILANFDEVYDHEAMMRDIGLVRAGFDVAAATLYPVIGNETGCKIVDQGGSFFIDQGKATRYDWEFVKGNCTNGVAFGPGEATDPKTGARFVGNFANGAMIDGVFSVVLEDGNRHFQIGGIPAEGQVQRALVSSIRPNGFQSHRYADIDNAAEFNGFLINIYGYTNKMIVRTIGFFDQGKLNGFGAQQSVENWSVWMGNYVDGTLTGIGAWSNMIDGLRVAEWQGGKQNGVGFGEYSQIDGTYHEFFVGRFVDGKKNGPFKVRDDSNIVFVENYEHGEFTGDSLQDDNFGQMFALAAGLAAIGAADLPADKALELGTAYSLDVLGDTGGTTMQSLQQGYQTGGTQSASGAAGAGSAGGGGLKSYAAQISCDSGTTSTINVPYRTEQCRVAAVDFATTYACNKLDQERVIRNCQAACGHPQCLEQ